MPIPQLRTRSNRSWKESSGHQNRRILDKKTLLKKLISASLILAAALIGIFLLAILWFSRSLPNPNQLMNREVAQSTKIYDRTGENVIYEISGDIRRTLLPLDQIPANVRNATLSIEDKNFYKHGAFSIWAMGRTLITNIIYKRSAGGSTLTQQFIKNAVLSNEKTITRKLKELILAYRLEKKFSKDEILQMYLNEIPYGSNAYGVEAASQKYFGKSVKDVSLAEAAILAALPQSPSRYSPYGPNKDILLGRKDYVLDLMAQQGYISEAERDEAKKAEIVFKNRENNMIAPHFVMYIKDLLAEKYGEKMIEQEGLKIYTTLDLYKQQIAEETITEKTKDYPQKYGANNAALVSVDPKTGQILAMVGSRDYFNDEIDGQVNVANRPRQPGSSMKPIVYAALFEQGYTPDTILYDVLTNFSTDPANPYIPHNYSGKEYGPVKIRQALAGSLNIPAVKAIYLAGVNKVIDLAENMGYSTLYPRDRFGLALVLGGAEVKLMEHTNAYSAFARDGLMSPLVAILKVEDKNGKVLEEYQPSEKKVLDSQVARMINSVLSDNSARSFIFGSKNFLTLGDRPVAAKTGTTNDFHDAWTIGYTPSLVTGVWVGNSDNAAMKGKADGSVLAAPIWHDYMAKVLGSTPAEAFKAPDDYHTGKAILDGLIPQQTVKVDVSTGELANDNTPPELINDLTVPSYHSILYFVDRNDPRGAAPTNPASDPQFALWETGVKNWAKKYASSTYFEVTGSNSGQSGQQESLKVKILSPLLNQAITNNSLDVAIEVDGNRSISRTEYFINGNLWQTRWGQPEAFNAPLFALPNGFHTLKARVYDNDQNYGEASVTFNLVLSGNPVSEGKNTLRLVSPSSALTVSPNDFPLSFQFETSHPERVASLNLLSKDQAGTAKVIKSLGGSSRLITGTWDSCPAPGAYSVFGQMRDWNGDLLTSQEVQVTVNK